MVRHMRSSKGVAVESNSTDCMTACSRERDAGCALCDADHSGRHKLTDLKVRCYKVDCYKVDCYKVDCYSLMGAKSSSRSSRVNDFANAASVETTESANACLRVCKA